ncbi:MAG: site-specific DNA-methyltransferase [Gammaproteobacteria bacterium]|nr:site-specific DNA-methyltransferase [Gammaproteobacteria bacterium]MCY4226699.1 site-specific DNA-methyltransferase [Gammaproteobacteria bacterium]
MTELSFKGKEFVYNHHLAVPFRPLITHAEKGIGETTLDGNLIIHGDNLHALKSLLPHYAGKVDCIFIDPPYNTGNENWCYNDNVNAPMIREWLDSNPVGIEDGLRHDKWCAMMWPRLRLLHELLGDTGLFFMALDDNEIHNARAILDEIFGSECFLATVSWVKRYTRSNNANLFYSMKDYLIAYRRSDHVKSLKEPRSNEADAGYRNLDEDPRGPWITSSYVNPATREQRKNLSYAIERPFDKMTVEHPTHAWKYSVEEHRRHVQESRLWWGIDGKAEYPRLKLYLSEAGNMVPVDVWDWSKVGSSDDGSAKIKEIFGSAVFDNPKPVSLIKKIISLVNRNDALFLDSFAGSGTTAHAVLEANKNDGGNRRFILVEMENYADELIAERVRRVIDGYSYSGTQRTELLREKITWSKLLNAHKLIESVQGIENLHAKECETINKTIKDGELIVTGETPVEERAEGLGGAFAYCTLGEPVELDRILQGEGLPPYTSLGAVLFQMATSRVLDSNHLREADFYIGEAEGQHVWLIYKPDLEWLKSPDAALTLTRAKTIAAFDEDMKHLVFAPARYVSQKLLAEQNLPIEFLPLPFSLYRLDRG